MILNLFTMQYSNIFLYFFFLNYFKTRSKEIFEKVDQNIKDMNEIYASFNNKSNINNYKEPLNETNEERDFTFPQESYEKKNFDDILSKPFSESPHENLYYKPLKLNNYFENN